MHTAVSRSNASTRETRETTILSRLAVALFTDLLSRVTPLTTHANRSRLNNDTTLVAIVLHAASRHMLRASRVRDDCKPMQQQALLSRVPDTVTLSSASWFSPLESIGWRYPSAICVPDLRQSSARSLAPGAQLLQSMSEWAPRMRCYSGRLLPSPARSKCTSEALTTRCADIIGTHSSGGSHRG